MALGLMSGTAAAQLPELPRLEPLPPPEEAVRQLVTPVQEAVHAPLPRPLEEIVEESPVAPLREEVREVVGTPGSSVVPGNGSPGGRPPGDAPSGGDRGGSSRGNPTVSAAAAAPAPAASPPRFTGPGPERSGSGRAAGGGSGGAEAGEAPDRTRAGAPRRADRSPGSAAGRRTERRSEGDPDAGADGATTEQDAAAQRTTARPDLPAAEGDGGPLVRTVNRIVEVVPPAVWIALGLLSLLALALFGRSNVDRRRARALSGERERLLRDMDLLERVLLPQVPERLGDLAASVAYRPAGGPAAGGDFYDVFELPGGRVAVVVGDVCGHGREALERPSSLRPALRGHLEAGLSPRAALQAAGRAAGIAPGGGFTTAVVAVHDPSSGTLTYATAGHPPPILVGGDSDEPPMVASAPPIGVGLPTGRRQTTVPLPRGSAACFFTDGILEARLGRTLLGREWLSDVIAGFGPLDSAAALLDRVIEEADATPDDMTACLVRAVAGSEAGGPRVEQLEMGPDDVGATAPGRFLAACGVPADAVDTALVEARRLIVQAGKALLTVTIDGDHASVEVTAATREVLTTT
jgi:Stage II sporulation protein E (SpoIIE)